MERDYSKFIDSVYDKDPSLSTDFNKAVKVEVRKTIKEDNIDDAVKNILALMWEIRYEW